MAELTPHFTWVLELSTGELLLIADALTNKLSTPERVAEARQLGDILLQKRTNTNPETRRKKR